MWYFADPFTYHVWLLISISIPIYLVIMGLSEYLYDGSVDWDSLCGFVLRNTLSEQNCKPIDYTQAYQKVLIIVWLLSVFVLVQSYAGSLTAMLAKPTFHEPIKTMDDLLNQREIPWVIEKGTLAEYFTSTAETGSAMRKLFEGATTMSPMSPLERFMYGCYTTTGCPTVSVPTLFAYFSAICEYYGISFSPLNQRCSGIF